ncbi:hypothetical protein Tco_0938510 [Tanacetum coccineum]|uniref:Uncharacterized protein n=1 Tax=Tanacetum coccineum TaxID=301880 RepID=A0ABQ5DHC4_9ASTR
MASDGSDQDARYTLSNLLQMGTVAEYENLLRARPKTLGEAFALARINEARFEDERATTIIAKPNDLNIRTGTKDMGETSAHTADKVKLVHKFGLLPMEEYGCQMVFL